MQQAAAIALHSPGKLYGRNRSLLKMGKKDLRKFAETKHAGLPKHTRGGLAGLKRMK
jgi:hypothetical protein